jgi:MFS family permease
VPAPDVDRLITPRFLLVTAAALAYFAALGMLLPVVPQYVRRDLDGNDLAVGVAVGAFAVGAIALRPIAGRLGDRYGRRVLLIGGSAVVALSVALYAPFDSLPVLVGLRLLTGAGEAFFFVGAGTMAADLAPEHRRGEAISYWSVAIYGGLAFGPLLGEIALGDDRYDEVWIIAAALTVIAMLLSFGTRDVFIGEPKPGEENALIHRSALAPGSILFLGLIGVTAFTAFMPLYVRDVGLDDSRYLFLEYGILVLIVRLVGARLPDRLGALRAGTVALIGIMAGMGVIAGWRGPAGLYVGTAVFAVGMSLLYPALLLLALAGTSEHERASVVGTFSTFFDLAVGLGAVIVGAVSAVAGYRAGFLAAAVLALTGLALLRGRREFRSRTAQPAPAPGV